MGRRVLLGLELKSVFNRVTANISLTFNSVTCCTSEQGSVAASQVPWFDPELTLLSVWSLSRFLGAHVGFLCVLWFPQNLPKTCYYVAWLG